MPQPESTAITLPPPTCSWCRGVLTDAPWTTYGTAPLHVTCIADYRLTQAEDAITDLQSLVNVLLAQLDTPAPQHAPASLTPELA